MNKKNEPIKFLFFIDDSCTKGTVTVFSVTVPLFGNKKQKKEEENRKLEKYGNK
ncbi:MAG: hypothetical protein LBB91_06200 [Clostridiales bacterium]|nr:hypothetical protein [Clostridiales bacterium]